MQIIRHIGTLLFSVCATLMMVGCAQNTRLLVAGESNGGGNTQVYANKQLPFPARPAPLGETEGNRWGALAYSPDLATLNDPQFPIIFGLGIVNNYASSQEAQQAAFEKCDADQISGCKVQVVYQDRCLSLAFGHENLAFGWAVASQKNQAQDNALKNCAAHNGSQNCQPLLTQCTAPAGSKLKPSLATVSPEATAKTVHFLAVHALQDAKNRDNGVTYKQACAQYDPNNFLESLYLNQLKSIYGPLKSYTPKQIYYFMMRSYIYDMSEQSIETQE